MSKSTRKPSAAKAGKIKPKKPSDSFPLFPHATGRWCKKVRGQFCYFGKVADDPEGVAALDLWLEQKDDLLAGRTPRTTGDGLTIRDLLNRFLTSKRHLVDTRELTHRSFSDYHQSCIRIAGFFGKGRRVDNLAAGDFERYRAELAKTRGAVALGNEIGRARVVFKYGFDSGLIDKPVRYGSSFNKPSKKTLRIARQANGSRLFEPAEIRQLLEVAPVQLRAMVLLGVNAGLGNADVSGLRRSHLDLDGGWLNYPRPKTGVERRCPLWPETVEAILEAIEARPKPKDESHADRVFLTKHGRPWCRDADIGEEGAKIKRPADKLAPQFTKLRTDAGVTGNGKGFYSLRNSFASIAGGSTDQVAVDHVMGHVDPSMAANYRHRIDDKRLEKVSEHVRRWLFPKPKKKGGKKA
ncbi:MAG: tyrosine-type recombinase/integrase [Planctomycetes bacterium]|nr:tyrosine-type recombinase/integrase [Planctomycetota bacterium]